MDEKRKIKFPGNLIDTTAEIHYHSLGGVGHSGNGSYPGEDGLLKFSHKISVMKEQK